MLASAADSRIRRYPLTGCLALLLALFSAGLAGITAAAAAPGAAEQQPAAGRTHMDETLRESIDKLIVVAGQDPSERELSGTYEKATPGLYGGMGQGGALGNPSTQVGPVTVGFPIPILTLPGMIAGGVAGATQREIQEFRDALAEEIEKASARPLQNDKLARYLYQELRPLPKPKPGLFAPDVPVPDDVDAVMYVDLPAISIDVDGGDAVLTTAARLKLTRLSDKADLYERVVHYQDRAPLARWTDNDNALFGDYANFALHWLARELAAESFSRVDQPQALAPAGSESLKLARRDPWQGDSKSRLPTLAWAVTTDSGAPADAWDLEIYDAKRLIYQQAQVSGNQHRLATPLEPCGHYFWSVRPVYRADGALRVGSWMRKPAEAQADKKADKKASKTAPVLDGIAGRDASVAPAYLQDFATLEIECRAT
jgi:hypothetical protein